MNKFYLAVGLFFIAISSQADCTSIGDGDWGDAGTWDCGREPMSTETVIISAGDEVTVDANYGEYSNMYIQIHGTLDFNNGRKLDLDETCQVDVYETGDISGGNGGSKLYVGDQQWTGGDPPIAGPAFVTSEGVTEGAILPVEWQTFESIVEGGLVELNWSTATEKNNDYFEIERSLDGVDFESLGTVPGNGTSSDVNSYSFSDPNPVVGMAYYRIKQVDFDGTRDYSSVIGVELSENAKGDCTVKIIPNPCLPQCDISYTACGSSTTNLDLQVFDSSGRLIHSYMSTSDLNQNGTFKVSKSDFSLPGIYIVKVDQTMEKMVIK